jgi:hypothetical protein
MGPDAAASDLSGGPIAFDGRLSAASEQLRTGEYAVAHDVMLAAGDTIRVRLDAREFDPYLILLGPYGAILLEVDDSPGAGVGVDEVFVAAAAGLHTLVVTSYQPGEMGAYRLEVSDATPPIAPTGDQGDLPIGAARAVRLEGLPNGFAWHRYRISVPFGTLQLRVILDADVDLDLFLKAGAPIANWETDFTARDLGPTGSAELVIDKPTPGDYFVDVVWLQRGDAVATYRIEVR